MVTYFHSLIMCGNEIRGILFAHDDESKSYSWNGAVTIIMVFYDNSSFFFKNEMLYCSYS